jgi:hypothetical protein
MTRPCNGPLKQVARLSPLLNADDLASPYLARSSVRTGFQEAWASSTLPVLKSVWGRFSKERDVRSRTSFASGEALPAHREGRRKTEELSCRCREDGVRPRRSVAGKLVNLGMRDREEVPGGRVVLGDVLAVRVNVDVGRSTTSVKDRTRDIAKQA